jgi:hypothetical protein
MRYCDGDDCTNTTNDGVLWRMNPKGEKGIFMCDACRARVERQDAPREPR